MSDQDKTNLLDWTKIGAVIIGQFGAVVAFAFILKADVDYLKRDVTELRGDMKQVSLAASEYKAESKAIALMAVQIASDTNRITKLESLFLPSKDRGVSR